MDRFIVATGAISEGYLMVWIIVAVLIGDWPGAVIGPPFAFASPDACRAALEQVDLAVVRASRPEVTRMDCIQLYMKK